MKAIFTLPSYILLITWPLFDGCPVTLEDHSTPLCGKERGRGRESYGPCERNSEMCETQDRRECQWVCHYRFPYSSAFFDLEDTFSIVSHFKVLFSTRLYVSTEISPCLIVQPGLWSSRQSSGSVLFLHVFCPRLKTLRP